MEGFKFNLKDPITITVSGEKGEVVGRAQYVDSCAPDYLVRYKAADGRAVESWWKETALH